MEKLTRFWNATKTKLKIAGGYARRGGQQAFGEFRWNAPAWMPIARDRSVAWVRANPKRAGGTLAGVVAIALGGCFGYHWWQNRPRPEYVGYNLIAPDAPSMDETQPSNPLRIEFAKSVASLKHTAKIDAKLVALDPPLEGEWTWTSDSGLRFAPKGAWPIGRKFRVRLSRQLFTPETLLEDYDPKFQAAPFGARVTKQEFYQNPENRKQKQVIVHVQFTHPADPESFKKRVSLRFDNRLRTAIPFSVTFGKKNREAYVVSEALEMPERDATAIAKIDSGYKPLAGGNEVEEKLEARVTVPGLKTFFRVASASIQLIPNEKLDTDQILSVALTDEIGEADFRRNFRVVALPEKKDADGKKVRVRGAGDVTPEMLKEAAPIELEMVPNEKDYSAAYNFKIRQPVGKVLLATVGKGMKSLGDFETAIEYKSTITVPNYPPLLQIQQTGGILSYSGEKKLALALRGIRKYRVAIARVQSAEVANLVSQTGGKFAYPEFMNYRFNYENIAESFSEDHDSGVEDGPESGKLHYGAIDLGKYLHAGGTSGAGARGLFHVRLLRLSDDGHEQGTLDQRLVVVTDLGMLVKQNADRSRDVFIQSIRSGGPVAGARVEVLGKNGLPVLAATTDGNGRASFPDLTDFRREKEPIAFVAKLGADLAFIPSEMRDRGLNLSRFDIGGVESSAGKDALSAFLFSERGIYRPGDEMNIGFIVKSENWSKKTDGVPVEAVVKDARGANAFRERLALSAQGFGSFRFRTMDTAPTGVYSAELYLVEKDGETKEERRTLLGSTGVKVEEFVPDTLKISAHLLRDGKTQDGALGWVNPTELKALVRLQNLYGTPAADHKISASFTLVPAFPKTPPALREYRFFDPKLSEKSYSERLDEKQANGQGEAEFDLDLARFETGTYRMLFDAEGFALEGGRSVGARASVIVSPLAHIVGYKSASNLDYLKLNSKASIHVLALNPELKPSAIRGAKVILQEVRTLSVLARDDDGVFRYQSVRKSIPVSEGDLALGASGANFELKTDQPGTFAVTVRQGAGAQEGAKDLLKLEYTVIGTSNILKKLERNSELQIKLGKTDYDGGEEIEMQITAPYAGAGLITIEREKVHAVKWFKTSSTSFVQRIRVPSSLEGNAYVHVTFVRDLGSSEIFTSPLSYGVVPFSISKKKREIAVSLEAPPLVRPGDTVEISYRTSKPAKIVVFGADEGILQVAGYKKPDPLAFFFRKRLLEVQTTQLLDLILPEFSVLKAASSSGGDMDAGLGKNLNPFKRKTDKPVVFWSGILDASAQAKKFRYAVPDYLNGQIHLFAVAVSEGAMGVGEESTTVKGDFIISPVAPLFTTPKDEFDVSVSVANNLAGSGKDAGVELRMSASPELQVVGDATAKLAITEGREAAAHFRVKTLDRLGAGKLSFTAGIGAKVAHYALEMSIAPAAPYETTISLGSVKDGKEDVKVPRALYAEFGKRVASVSALPLVYSHGLAQYLSNNPYGCTEQLVSKAFPILVLRGRKDFAKVTAENAKNLDAMAAILRSRQNGEGGFSTWAGSEAANEFYTAYAAHFLLEAQERGYPFPTEVRSRALSYLKDVALERSPTTLADARLKAYELYVLARAGEVRSSALVSLREKLDKDLKDWKKDVAAIFLAGVYKLYHQDAQADELLADRALGEGQETDYEHYVDGLFRDGVYLHVVSRHFPAKLSALKPKELERFAEPIRKGEFNTVSSAMAILGLESYAAAIQGSGALKAAQLSEKIGKEWRALETGGLSAGDAIAQAAVSLEATQVRVQSPGETLAFYQVSEAGFDREPSEKEVRDGLEVSRSITDLDGNAVRTARVGQTYVAHLRFRSLKQARSNVAIIDRIPSGFEIVLDRSRPQTRAEEGGESGDSHPAMEGGEGEGSGDGARGDGGEGEGASFWHRLLPANVYAGESAAASSFVPEYLDLREDRVVVYARATTEIQEFTYQLKATSAGKFLVPAVYAEDMYDRRARARSEAGRIEVERAK